MIGPKSAIPQMIASLEGVGPSMSLEAAYLSAELLVNAVARKDLVLSPETVRGTVCLNVSDVAPESLLHLVLLGQEEKLEFDVVDGYAMVGTAEDLTAFLDALKVSQHRGPRHQVNFINVDIEYFCDWAAKELQLELVWPQGLSVGSVIVAKERPVEDLLALALALRSAANSVLLKKT